MIKMTDYEGLIYFIITNIMTVLNMLINISIHMRIKSSCEGDIKKTLKRENSKI